MASKFEELHPKPMKPKEYTPDNQITMYQRNVMYWELQKQGWLQAKKHDLSEMRQRLVGKKGFSVNEYIAWLEKEINELAMR